MADQPFKLKKVQDGESIDYTPSGAKDAGTLVIRGGIIGVLNLDLAADELGAIDVVGVYDGAKDSSVFTDGQAVYWNPTGNPVGGTSGSGALSGTGTAYYIGRAIVDAESPGLTGTATIRVLLQPSSGFGTQSPSTAIADPGDGVAIPVTASGYVPIVTGGAETRTLAAPAFAGEELLLSMKTDGGDCVITCATGINQTGNNTITMNDAGDSIRFNAIVSGSNLRWRVMYNDGCSLSTV